MPAYATFEAEHRFSELLDRAERGEEVVITRDGKAVAKLVAQNDETAEQERVRAAREHLRQTREMLKASGVTFTQEEIRELRDEGRM